MKDVVCYWKELLLKYEKLIQYDVKMRDGLIQLN